MTGPRPYRLLGGLGSPYSMKMRAILRYRRLPHIWLQLNEANAAERTQVKAPVIPILQFPDGSYQNDSTPLIYALEERHPGEREIVPPRAGDAFLAFLLEDMADEWATKLMFHFRWDAERDQRQMSEWLAYDRAMGGGREAMESYARMFRDRQVGRMALVGSTRENAPLIDETARRLLSIFETHVVGRPFFFGSRPSLAEFAWYGQLSQLIVDPTPNDLLRAVAPYTVRWLMHIEDLSGLDGEWRAGNEPRAGAVDRLLQFAGDVYMPFLAANAAAVQAGEAQVRMELLGQPYSQGAFRYQARCFRLLRQAWADLPAGDQADLSPLLSQTGVLPYLVEALRGS